jgi:hypothetical protein
MFSKKSMVLMTLAPLAAGALVLTQSAWTHQQPNKLEGAWITKVPGYPIQWISVLSPSDSSGQSAAMSGSIQVRIPIELMYPAVFPEVDASLSSLFVGNMVMTAHNKAKWTMVGHGLKKVVPTIESPFTEQVVLIWVASGESKFSSPGKFESTGAIAYYRPDADGDGDGLPDVGAIPVVCLPASSISTRVGQAPCCTP